MHLAAQLGLLSTLHSTAQGVKGVQALAGLLVKVP
jgi:hypothetical protein